MSDRETPPRVFISYSHDSREHKEQVRLFATFLREVVGLDVRVDTWDDDRRRDWSAWAVEHLEAADFILIVASPAYKRRADGLAPPHEGVGAQFEAAILRNHLTRDLRGATERLLPVVLPGGSKDDIPAFLNGDSTTRYEIDDFTWEGVDYLLTAITKEGDHPLPARGVWRGRPRTGSTGAAAPNAPNGTVAAPPRSPVRLADLRWLARSEGVHHGRASIGGVDYDHSIILRPATATAGPGFVEVDLAPHHRHLTAVIGVLDDATEREAMGQFQVIIDGRPQPPRRASWGMPTRIEVDLTGVRHLRLEMHRPGTATSPLLPGALAIGGRSPGLPELAWGNPTLT